MSAAVFALPGVALADDPHAEGGGPPPTDASGELLEDIADGSVDTTSVDDVADAIDSPTFDQYQGNSPAVTDGGGSSDLPKASDTSSPSVPTCPSSGDTSGGGDSVIPSDSDSVKLVGDPSDTSDSGSTPPAGDDGSTPPPGDDTSSGGGDAPGDNTACGGGGGPDEPAEGGGGPDDPPAVGGGNGGPDDLEPAANPVASGGGGGLPFTGLGLASIFGIGTALLAFGVSMHIRARRRRAAGITPQGFDGFGNRMA